MTIPESIRALIATGPPAYLTTLNADGSPQVTLVWVGTEKDEIVRNCRKVYGLYHRLKRSNVKHTTNCREQTVTINFATVPHEVPRVNQSAA